MRVRGEIWILIVILAIGALLRGLYLAEIVHSPGFSAPQVDAGYHDYWARALITGKWNPPPPFHDPLIRTAPYFRPPGYPYFLALVYLLTGSSYLGARIVQMALGLLSALLAFLFGRRWFGSRMGLIFAGLMSVYWGFIYFEGDLVEPALVSVLAMLLIWDLSRWTEKTTFARSMLSGLILGLSALVRPNVLLFGPAILIWAWWVIRDRRRFVTASLGLILAAGLTISPAAIRNYVVAHDFVPISSNAGINLLLGNNEKANGTISTMIPGIGEFDTCYDYPRLVSAVEAKVGRPLKDSEVSAYLGAQAKEYMRTHPLDTLELTWRKALLFWGPKEVGNNKEDEIERANSPVLHRIPGNFAAATALFMVGLLAPIPGRKKKEDGRRFQVSILVILFIGAYFISYLPYFAAGRFRMAVAPFLLFFGAVGLDRMIRLATERNLKAVGVWLLVLIAAYGLASRNFSGYQADPAKWHYDRGFGFAGVGKTDDAIREYEASLAINPDYPAALFNLGSLLESKGRYDEAMAYFEAALRIDPNDYWSHYAMAKMLAGRGKLDEAAGHYRSALESEQSPTLYFEYAGVLVGLRKLDEAAEAYRDAIRLEPGYAGAHNNLAVVLFFKGDYAGAWEEIELCRQYGGNVRPGLLKALSLKMPEPH